jgi:hypothetical protein
MSLQSKKLKSIRIDIPTYNTVSISPSKLGYTDRKSTTPTSKNKTLIKSPRYSDSKIKEIKAL